MLVKTDVVSTYNIEKNCFFTFIKETERLYNHRGNAYHNFKHAITVMNSCYRFLKVDLVKELFLEIGISAFMFGSLMHDIDHTSRNNMFEINSYSHLAITYNDDSVLENHHAATAFEVLKKKGCNIFQNMDPSEFPLFRQYVIHGILSTDIKKHFGDIKFFKERLDDGDFNPQEGDDSTEDFLLLFGTLIHCSDLYVPTFDVDTSFKWS